MTRDVCQRKLPGGLDEVGKQFDESIMLIEEWGFRLQVLL